MHGEVAALEWNVALPVNHEKTYCCEQVVCVCALECLFWKGFISHPMTQYVGPPCGHMSHLLLKVKVSGRVLIHLCHLWKIRWRRPFGILTVALPSMWQSGVNQEHSRQSKRCRMSVHVFAFSRTERRREWLEETDIVCPPDLIRMPAMILGRGIVVNFFIMQRIITVSPL